MRRQLLTFPLLLTVLLSMTASARAQAPNGVRKLRELGQKAQVSGAAFSHDGTQIITCDWSGAARTWDLATGMPKDQFQFNVQGHDIANGREAERAGQLLRINTVLPWNDKSWLILQPEGYLNWQPGKKPGPTYSVNEAIITQYAKGTTSVLVLASADPDKGPYSVVDLKTRKKLSTLKGLDKQISHCSFSADGKRLLTHCADGNVTQVWDLKKGTLLYKLGSSGTDADHQNAVALSADGGLAIAGSGQLRIWELTTGDERPPIRLPTSGAVLALAITPDASRVVALTTSGDPVAKLQVFNLESGKLLGQGEITGKLNGDIDQDLIISPDGRLAVTFRGPRQPGVPTEVGGARIWQLPTGR